MGIFSTLVTFISTQWYVLTLAIQASKIAQRMLLVAFLGAIYVSCVTYFSNMIAPWFSGLMSSGSYAAPLGLLFPPVAGTVLAALVHFWLCVASVRYLSSLSKTAFG